MVDLVSDVLEDLAPQFGMLHLTTTEHDRDLDLVTLAEELFNLSGLGVEVAGPDLGPVLHFLDRQVRGLLPRFLGALIGFVLELAVVHDPANRWVRPICDLDQVESGSPSDVERLG